MRKWLLVFLVAIAFEPCLQAQETTSEIAGQVVSSDKTPLAGATLTAVHEPSGSTYKTTSRSDGRFNLANLRIGGPYTVTVTYVGYQPSHQEDIYLVLGQEFRASFVMTPEAKQLSEVVVTSPGTQGKVFNSSHTGNQEIITRAQMERLPTINRSLLDFTKLTPVANGLSFGGQSSQYNNITVDGANFNNSFGLSGTLGGQTNSQPISLDALEQIQVNVSPYDVRQGGFSGAGINSVTRSGTNQFRGTVYTYIKGPGTQGYKVGDITVPRQDYSYNLTGFSVGGPIIPGKLFFFVNGEMENRTDPATSWVASSASNPANGVSVSNANQDTLNALASFLKNTSASKTWSYDPGQYQGYSYVTQSKKVTIRLDWNIDPANSVTIKYNFLKSSRQTQASNSGSVNSSYGRTPGNYAMPFNGSGYTINNNFDIFIAEWNTRLSNKATNKLQVGYTALRDFRSAATSSPFPLVDILDGSGNPYTSFGYEQFTYGNLLNTDVWQLNDIFTYYKGPHEITLGFQGAYKKYENGFSPSYQGVYRFKSLSDFYAAVADPNVKALRYDLSYTLPPDGPFPLVGPVDYELGFFAQDKWRIKPNLTLIYGLRIDIPIFKNTFLQNDSVAALTGFYNGVTLNTGQGPTVNPLFGPRIGFNWDVNGDQKTQVRGGIGLFAGPPPFVWISNQTSNSGVALFGSISNSTTASFSPQVDPNPNWPANATKSASSSYSLNVTDPSFRFPQALKSSIAIDQKLPKNYIVTLEFTWAKDVNAVFFQNVNLPDPSAGTPLIGADNRIHYPASQIYAVGGPSKATPSNPNIGNAIYMTNVNEGWAYTATLQIQKNFKNLYLNAAYTYSMAKDVMVGGSTAATMWGSKPISGDPNAAQVGYSNSYMPQRIIASASYRFVYGKNFATTVGLLFEAAPSGIGSYVYSSDLNGDGQTSNDLLYIPTEADYASGNYKTANGGGTDTRTPDEVWAQINAYIKQDGYLNKHRGQYAERNALIFPWYKRVDMNVTQDVYMKIGQNTHTLRLSVDIVNVGNLINSSWGVYQLPAAGTGSSILASGVPNVINVGLISSKVTNNVPVYSFPYQIAASKTPYTTSWKDDTSLASRWQMQFGIRYLFN